MNHKYHLSATHAKVYVSRAFVNFLNFTIEKNVNGGYNYSNASNE
jgi:hypothetical protein